jgi:LacI family transcriptional regulator
MTIKKVALEAGVSTATVSRVINNTGVVQDETRDKILRAINKLGYKPSTRQQIRSSNVAPLKHRNVALIWTGTPEAAFSETGQKMALGILKLLQQLGASLTVDHITSPDHIPQCLIEGKIDGILLQGSEPSAAICSRLRHFPAVWLLQAGSVTFGDHVQPDHGLAGRLAAKHLINQRCKHLCCISYTPVLTDSPPYSQTRALGFKTYAELSGTRCTVITRSSASENKPLESQIAAKQIIDEFNQMTPRPDGLFVTNDLAPFIHQELIRQKIIPQKDIQLVISNDACLSPQPAGINVFDQEIGKLAVDALLWRIKNPNAPIVTYSIKPQLIMPSSGLSSKADPC